MMPNKKSLLTSPRVAWPTLILLAAAVAMWTLGIAMGVTRIVPAFVAFLGCAVGAYIAFTPLHEAAHRSIAARAPWVSAVVGRIAGIPLMGPFVAVRHFHLEHHKHTNDADADPDHWSGRGPAWALPLRWLTQDVHYYMLYARTYRDRPAKERAEVLLTMAAIFAVVAGASALGHAREVFLFYVLPARLAIFALAFAFDYLPHRPHVVTSRIDRFRATSVIESRILLHLFLGQSLHLVHHLYPAVPFYRYARVWRSGLCQPKNQSERVRALSAGLSQ